MTTSTDLTADDLDTLLSDENVASLLQLSVAWLRKQRRLKRKGQPYVFTVEPILIGDTLRYRKADLKKWLDSR